MLVFRRAHPILTAEHFYADAEIHWFDPQGKLPNRADANAKQFACLIHEDERSALYLLFNAGTATVDFALPPAAPAARRHLAADTSREVPEDVFAAGEDPLLEDSEKYSLSARSCAIILLR